MTARALRVSHARYGLGWWQRLADAGQAFVRFDADRVERRVLVKDLNPSTQEADAPRSETVTG